MLKYAGLIQVESFLNRIRRKMEVDHHDMGFLYTPACVAAYRLTGNERAKEAAILAADQLPTRFQPKGGFLQAWGAMGEKDNYRYIIDCLMNLPLLYWASEVTGEAKYRDIALRHTDTCLTYSVRPDGSTFHTYFELFGYYECENIAYAEKIQAESPVIAHWNDYMRDVMVMSKDPVTGAQPLMRQVFLLE